VANIRRSRKSGFTSRGGVMRRETQWFNGVTVRSTIVAASTAVLQTALTAAELALRPFTVVRTRGVVYMKSDQAGATEVQDAAFGLAVVSDQAIAIGVTAVPTPTTDDGSDLWYVYERILSELAFQDATGFQANVGVERIIDSRSMRKVEDGQDIAGVVETGSGSNGVVISAYARTLIKLH